MRVIAGSEDPQRAFARTYGSWSVLSRARQAPGAVGAGDKRLYFDDRDALSEDARKTLSFTTNRRTSIALVAQHTCVSVGSMRMESDHIAPCPEAWRSACCGWWWMGQIGAAAADETGVPILLFWIQ